MTWTIDLDAASPATLAPLPDVLAAAVNEALARPAGQQPPWPDPEEVAASAACWRTWFTSPRTRDRSASGRF